MPPNLTLWCTSVRARAVGVLGCPARRGLGSAALHHHRIRDGAHQRRMDVTPSRMDRAGQLRRAQRGGTSLPGPVRARYGRNSGHSMPGLCHDVATVIVRGLSAARPLTGEGVKFGIEQVKVVPAASGAPGTFLRFGRYIRQGWLGSDYLIARRVVPDGTGTNFMRHPATTSHARSASPPASSIAPNTGAVTMPGGAARTSGILEPHPSQS